MKKSINFSSIFLLVFFLFDCSSTRYRQPHIAYQKEPTDLPELLQPLVDSGPHKKYRPSKTDRKLWKNELEKVDREVPKGTMQYSMYVAHCLANLDEHEKSAQSYLEAAKKAKDPKIKKRLQIAAVNAFAEAGQKAELEGNAKEALKMYQSCNKWCRRFGFELHVPHKRMQRLKQAK